MMFLANFSQVLLVLLFFQLTKAYPEITLDNPANTNMTDSKEENFKQTLEMLKSENVSDLLEIIQDLSQNNSNASLEVMREIFLELICPTTWTWILIFCHCVVFVIGIVGNCLVCVAVYRNHTMRTVTNYFIVNLAAADFLVILFCLPPSVIWDVTLTWWFGTVLCKIVLYLQVCNN
ncbi:unnamed protein product [Psylliodes chrysocephalus]|uniref:G-protein coupled receptors family 1 profile domain-containing protein n=1 Tax=Psylliodes chrysocephalus TaxID=3402493 RepID=A0A9P0G919_9CUCU|nr:unnamed protein product [Psylliodes chrysocephala]